MRERLRAARLVLGYTYRSDPRRTVASAAVTFLTMCMGSLLVPVLLRYLTDAALHRDQVGVMVAAALLVAEAAATLAGFWAGVTLRLGLGERATLYFDTRMAELASGIHHLEHLERPKYLDELFILQHNHQVLASVQNTVVNAVSMVVRLTLSVVLLAAVDPWLALLPLATVPSLLASKDAARRRHEAENRVAPARRLLYRLYLMGGSAEAAKELRVYDVGDDLLARTDRARAEVHRIEDAEAIRAAVLGGLGWLAYGVGFVAAMLLVAHQAAAGKAGAGDVVLALTLAFGLNAGFANLASNVDGALDGLKTGQRMAWLEDLAADAAPQATPVDPQTVPAVLRDGIRLHDVSFRYPGTEAEVLHGVELFLPAGSTVAIVGDNGAGKTTLAKLLCRFYEPTSGGITVDGVNLAEVDVAAWRARLAGCFQDFARPELLAREAVGIGDLAALDDRGAVVAALDRAHAGDVEATLPDGLATLLGRSFEGGVEPSTGQWQKLALGRAMMREEPLLLVLDEPTASLDPDTEHALFERYASAAAAAATRSGAITVLVSHRFSTVRMADLIVVVVGGRVAEVGSHAELIAAGGRYAQLYELQARAYR